MTHLCIKDLQTRAKPSHAVDFLVNDIIQFYFYEFGHDCAKLCAGKVHYSVRHIFFQSFFTYQTFLIRVCCSDAIFSCKTSRHSECQLLIPATVFVIRHWNGKVVILTLFSSKWYFRFGRRCQYIGGIISPDCIVHCLIILVLASYTPLITDCYLAMITGTGGAAPIVRRTHEKLGYSRKYIAVVFSSSLFTTNVIVDILLPYISGRLIVYPVREKKIICRNRNLVSLKLEKHIVWKGGIICFSTLLSCWQRSNVDGVARSPNTYRDNTVIVT